MVNRTLLQRSKCPRNSKSSARRLRVENLEDRRVLSADPGWLATIGGPERDYATSIATDDVGDVYVAGTFSATVDFDPGEGIAELTAIGASDGYVAKFTSQGALVWARRMGGLADTSGSRDSVGAIAVGSDGFVYAGGRYLGEGDFDGDGLAEQINRGGSDLFVAKLASDTGSEVWTKTFGGNGFDFGVNLAIAADGSAFVTGTVSDSSGIVDVDPGSGVASIAAAPNGAIFVLKLDASGNYLTSWGGIPTDTQATPKIAVDDSGVYLGGVFYGTVDFDPGTGQAIRSPLSPQDDMFVARYSQQGDFDWVRTLRGTGAAAYEDFVQGLTIDADRIYVAGNFYVGLDVDEDGTADLPGSATRDIFVASYAKSDGSLNWAHNAGTSSGDDSARVLGIDSSGALLAYGYFSGTVDFDPGPGVSILSTTSQTNFSWRLDATTGAYLDASQLDGRVVAVDADSDGLLYLAGYFTGDAAFPNGDTVTSAGDWDGFILKFNATGPQVVITSPTSDQTILEGTSSTFTGTASDVDDGNLTSSLTWQSQLMGSLGTGGSIGPLVLTVGAHQITAQATDSDGLVSARSVSVSVNPKAPTNLTGSVSGAQVTLHWLDKSAGEEHYQVERAAPPKGKNGAAQWSVVATLDANATSYTDSPGSGNWLYRVQATAPGVASAYSNELSISIAKGGRVKTTAGVNSALTASAQTTAVTTSTSSDLHPTSLSSGSNQASSAILLLAPTKPSAKSKLVDAALEDTDATWLESGIDSDLIEELLVAG